MSGIEIISQTMILPTGMPLGHVEQSSFALLVEYRGEYEGKAGGGWRVHDRFKDLSRAGNWGHPQRFQQHQYRWETRDEALEMARNHVDTHKMARWTFAEFEEMQRKIS